MPFQEASVPASPRASKPLPVLARRWRAAVAALLTAVVGSVGAAAAATAGPESGAINRKVTFNSMFQHGSVQVDGVTLHYVRGGSGPALVLLHGWPETWWAWHSVMPGLAQERTVIAFDLPGLGDSSEPAGGYDKVTTAARIRQAVHLLGYQQVEIMAHDVGAMVAYPYARDYPNEVTRLAVIETPLPGFGLEDFYRFRWHFLFNAAPYPIPERIMDNEDVTTYLGMFFDGARHPERIDRNVYYWAYADPDDRHAGYEYYRAFAADAANFQANVGGKLPMPVMAMGAQYLFGPIVANSFRQVANDVRQVVVPDSGHFVPEENPEFLTACAKYFFGAVAGPPPAEYAACAA